MYMAVRTELEETNAEHERNPVQVPLGRIPKQDERRGRHEEGDDQAPQPELGLPHAAVPAREVGRELVGELAKGARGGKVPEDRCYADEAGVFLLAGVVSSGVLVVRWKRPRRNWGYY